MDTITLETPHAALPPFAQAARKPSTLIVPGRDFTRLPDLLAVDRVAEGMIFDTPEVLLFDANQIDRTMDGNRYLDVGVEPGSSQRQQLGGAYEAVIKFIGSISAQSGLRLDEWFIHSASAYYHVAAGGLYHLDMRQNGETEEVLTLATGLEGMGTLRIDGDIAEEVLASILAAARTYSNDPPSKYDDARRKVREIMIQAGVKEAQLMPGQTIAFTEAHPHAAPVSPQNRATLFTRWRR